MCGQSDNKASHRYDGSLFIQLETRQYTELFMQSAIKTRSAGPVVSYCALNPGNPAASLAGKFYLWDPVLMQ